MEFAQLLGSVKNVHAGTKLHVTFKTGEGPKGLLDDATALALRKFSAMILVEKSLMLGNLTPILLLSGTLRSRLWRNDTDRTFVVTTTAKFSSREFAEHVGPGIDSITVE